MINRLNSILSASETKGFRFSSVIFGTILGSVNMCPAVKKIFTDLFGSSHIDQRPTNIPFIAKIMYIICRSVNQIIKFCYIAVHVCFWLLNSIRYFIRIWIHFVATEYFDPTFFKIKPSISPMMNMRRRISFRRKTDICYTICGTGDITDFREIHYLSRRTIYQNMIWMRFNIEEDKWWCKRNTIRSRNND